VTIARDLRTLPNSPQTTATYPSLFRADIENHLVALRDAEGPLVQAGPNSRIRHSWAGMCARRIGYSVSGAEEEPNDAESLWSFALGRKAHEIVQDALLAAYGFQCSIEHEVDLGDRSCHIDALLDLEKPKGFEIDGVTHIAKTVCFELKSTGGYSWSLQVKTEGPKLGAYLQGCLNAAAVDADLLVIGYLALDRQSKTARTLYGPNRLPLDAVWATWAYTREQYMPDAEREAKRLSKVLEVVDSGRLPERVVPELPHGAKITDPKTGHWLVLGNDDQEGLTVVQAGEYWGCNFCSHQKRCAADAEAEKSARA